MLEGKLYQVIFLDLISCACVRVPVDCSPPGSSVRGFSRQEYWRGLPFPLLYLLHWHRGSLPLAPPCTPHKAWERNGSVGCRMQMRTQSPELVCNLGGTEPQQQPGSRAQADGLGPGAGEGGYRSPVWLGGIHQTHPLWIPGGSASLAFLSSAPCNIQNLGMDRRGGCAIKKKSVCLFVGLFDCG